MMKLLNKRNPKRAQGMTEYIIIVGLIAVGIIIAVGAFRDQLNNAFTASTKEVKDKVTDKIGK